jgi:hypothetical protein
MKMLKKTRNINMIWFRVGGIEISMWKRHLHLHVYCSPIHNSQDMESTGCPLIYEWVVKM